MEFKYCDFGVLREKAQKQEKKKWNEKDQISCSCFMLQLAVQKMLSEKI